MDDDDQSVGSASEDNIDGDMDDIPMQVTAKIAAQNPSAKASSAAGAGAANEAAKLSPFQDALLAASAHQFSAPQQTSAKVAAQLASQQEAAAKLQQERVSLASLPPQMPSALGMQVGNVLDGGSGGGAVVHNVNMLNAMVAGVNTSGTGSTVPTGLVGLPLGLLAHQANAHQANAVPVGAEREKLLQERKEQWLLLLANRPHTTDGDTMSAWLIEVLSVSDLTMPLNNPNSTGEKTEPTNDEDEGGDDVEDDYEEENSEGQQDEEDDEGGGEGSEGSKVNSKGEKFDTGEKKRTHLNKESPRSVDSKTANNTRPADSKGEAEYNVSFAEWRDRKKQKKALARN